MCCHVCVLTVCGHYRPGCVVVKLDLSANGAIANFGTEQVGMDLMCATHVRTPSDRHYGRVNHYPKNVDSAWDNWELDYPM